MTVTARPPEGPSDLVRQYRDDFAIVLPSHIRADTWCRVAIGALRRDPNLNLAARNNPAAFLGALLDAARLGLEPGTEQYYLVPQKVKGQLQVRGQRGYQGEIELMYRAGAVSSVVVETVKANDRFVWNPGRMDRPQHDVDWFTDRGRLVGVYAYAVMRDGATSKVVVLNFDDIKRAKQSSQGSDSQYSPWKNHEEAMWLKTAAHRLTKWVPTSAEYMREQFRARADVAAETAPPESPALTNPQPVTETRLEQEADTTAGEVWDAEEVASDAAADAKTGEVYAPYVESDPSTEEKW